MRKWEWLLTLYYFVLQLWDTGLFLYFYDYEDKIISSFHFPLFVLIVYTLFSPSKLSIPCRILLICPTLVMPRSLMSRRWRQSSSAPWMSCRLKWYLYSPNWRWSNQSPTSARVHFSTSLASNQTKHDNILIKYLLFTPNSNPESSLNLQIRFKVENYLKNTLLH